MEKKYVITFLILLILAAPFGAAADRFYIEPADMELGKTNTLQFVLDNTQDYYGFQAGVKLPTGLMAVKGSDGELDITLSARADDGDFKVNSNLLADGSLIMGAFTTNHNPFTGDNGVLVYLKISVAEDFAGGIVEVSNIMFINSEAIDVEFESTSASIGVIVTDIVLSKTELNITEGETAALTATIAPENATDKSVTWTSSDESIATVSDEGVVTAVQPGTATIIATSVNGKTATCAVTVAVNIISVESIAISKTELSMTEGDTTALTAIITPENATDKSVTWTSSDESVATVSDNGVVTAVKAGSATITVASSNGKTATCKVTVAAKVIVVEGISLSETELSLIEGDTATLTATIAPENATDKYVTWTSSDESVATVSDNGVVTAVKAGSATITVASSNGKTATCKVTVAAKVIEVTDIILSKTELSMIEGETATLTATIAPENATDKSVTWTSSDESIATVSAEGVVTAVKAGIDTITVASSNGKTATCKVSVAAKIIEVEGISLSETELSLTEGYTATLTATIAPENATDKSVSWTSSDASIATVSAKGVVTAKAIGDAVITASCGNVSATCNVHVLPILAESIVIDPTEWSGEEGCEFKISATVLPENVTDKTLTFESSDESVATADAEGNVKVLKEGTCVILVSTVDGSNLKAECVITSLSGVDVWKNLSRLGQRAGGGWDTFDDAKLMIFSETFSF